ncbi:hypothetical protein MLD38_007666 [Melastoma candidum]|uniref:Uncharacterized protein n=1 Tax=Melastoma candidum TaxID=119954 RepID=A0ACB9RSD4_9MYRT|nr:hypothetical protein MLD38_007666 [Melastoma candidum]
MRKKLPRRAVQLLVQVGKKSGGAFGAMLGNSGLKRKENESKLEAIRSSVNLPFRTFSSSVDPAGKMAGIEGQAGIWGRVLFHNNVIWRKFEKYFVN